MPQSLTDPAAGPKPYYPALDGVRAYCVLLVMFDHLKAGPHTLPWLNGHLGVDIFFILSGFLITSLLRREQAVTGRVDFPAFYWRRFFRIVPVYLAVLLLYVAICHLPSQAERWTQLKAGLPWFLTFMNEFAREPNAGSVFTHTWSLGVEEKFYLVWPPLFFLLASSRIRRTALLATMLMLLAVAPWFGHGYLARAYFGLYMGCLMAVLLTNRYGLKIMPFVQSIPAWLAGALFALGFLLEHLSKNLMFAFSALTVLFLTHLIVCPDWLARLHTGGVITWLGRRSYAMYLVHVLCLNAFEGRIRITSGLRAGLVLLAAYALAALMAELLYRAVEQPAREFGRQYLASRTLRRQARFRTSSVESG